MARQKDDRNLEFLFHQLGRPNPIDVAVKPDVHQDQVWLILTNSRKNFFPASDTIADDVPERCQLIGDVGCGNRLVFDHKNRASARHGGIQQQDGIEAY